MTCVKNKEIDFLITEHIKAKALRVDTALLLHKIYDFKEIINYQDLNTKALNLISADQTKIISTYKEDYTKLQSKFAVVSNRASRRGKGVLILICTTVIAGAIAVLKP